MPLYVQRDPTQALSRPSHRSSTTAAQLSALPEAKDDMPVSVFLPPAPRHNAYGLSMASGRDIAIGWGAQWGNGPRVLEVAIDAKTLAVEMPRRSRGTLLGGGRDRGGSEPSSEQSTFTGIQWEREYSVVLCCIRMNS